MKITHQQVIFLHTWLWLWYIQGVFMLPQTAGLCIACIGCIVFLPRPSVCLSALMSVSCQHRLACTMSRDDHRFLRFVSIESENLVEMQVWETVTVEDSASLVRRVLPSVIDHVNCTVMQPHDWSPVCVLCSSHLDCKSADQAFAKDGYFCPQCLSKYCDLPVDCVTCGRYGVTCGRYRVTCGRYGVTCGRLQLNGLFHLFCCLMHLKSALVTFVYSGSFYFLSFVILTVHKG